MQLGGAVLIGTSTWGVRNNAELSNAIPPSGVTLILVAGVFLVVLSIAGIIGVCFKTKVLAALPSCARRCCLHNSRALCLQRFGRWFLVLYAMTLIVAIVCEIVGAGIVLQALGKFSTSWTADVEKDTIATWINDTWVDCCLFPNGTERVQYVCWTALNTDAVNAETCASGPLFRKAFVDWITTKLTPAGAVGLTLFLLQFIACITAFCFLCKCSICKSLLLIFV